ncbi:unnamed protein product [Rodentolepis nana]|uniref:DUF5727 domain-containing protein n=1 Tax=Rodentolepis nana TaxID=102285 RepID=A0A0R3TTC6_RODNA|nr:unnamed protein product [Rodentolepis nana]
MQLDWNDCFLDNDPTYCRNLSENKTDDRLEYKIQYKRNNSDEVNNFVFGTKDSEVAITVYWLKKGESPDVAECNKHYSLMTSSRG